MMTRRTALEVVHVVLLQLWAIAALKTLGVVRGELVINEVAYRGTSDACNGEDWLELYNSGPNRVDMTSYLLHDDKGMNDEEAFVFPMGYMVAANTYLVLCTKNSNSDANATTSSPTTTTPENNLSPQFGIGDDDTLALVRVDGNIVEVVSIVGPLPGASNDKVDDVTYALDPSTGLYNYTATGTPGALNIMTPLPTEEELARERKTILAAQNDAGIDFFNFDRRGMPVPSAMDPVLELRISMADADYADLTQNPQYQEYQDFRSASVVTKEGGVELLALESPGRIRTRGEEGVYMAACLGSPLPFRLDFDSTNETQSLFGVSRLYLRHPVFDPSHMREWVYPRMLARFGLPHVRTRMVHFYINDILQGFYVLMEQPEQEYIFARNFPNYNPTNFALFQTTRLTEDCGLYFQSQLVEAEQRIDELKTPPYAFERGDHIAPFGTLGPDKMQECKDSFNDYFHDVLMEDVVLAYLRNDEECSKLFLNEGLIDQELGTDNWDNEIKNWIDATMSWQRCEPQCKNLATIPEKADLDNFLKTFAFYAVTLNVESPMGNVNNHYLTQEESKAEKWKLLSFDFSKPGSPSCNPQVCESRFVTWSVTRPTCESLESNSLVGPFLTNETLHEQYISYIREFLPIYTNKTFIQEIINHATAIEDAVKESLGGNGTSFDDELSPNAADWNSGNYPLLPLMKARSGEVQKQLDALDAGTFPRGPQVGATTDNEPWETCPDWQMSAPDTSMCKEGCKYEGCFMEGWDVASFCEESTGTCYHGHFDIDCLGIADGDRYDGMEERGTANTFCRFAQGTPVKASECPAEGAAASGSGSAVTSGANIASHSKAYAAFCVLVLVWLCVVD